MELNGTIRQRARQRLADLQLLLKLWSGALWLLMAVGTVLLAGWLAMQDWKPEEPVVVGAFIAGLVTLFGHLFSKLADFRKQYIDIEHEVLGELEQVQKRLVAFHAEIGENLSVLYSVYAPGRRQLLIQRISEDVEARRFTRSDTSNPIYEENREHLYQFSASAIRCITNYYNLESNLNLAVEALLMKEFNELKPRQKLEWYIYMLGLVNEVAEAGQSALAVIAAEAGVPDLEPRHKDIWSAISDDELEPLTHLLAKLSAVSSNAATRSEG